MAWMLLHKAEMYAATHDTCAVRGRADTFRVRLRIACNYTLSPNSVLLGFFALGHGVCVLRSDHRLSLRLIVVEKKFIHICIWGLTL